MSLRCKYNDLCKTSYTKDKFDIKNAQFSYIFRNRSEKQCKKVRYLNISILFFYHSYV